MPAPAGRLGVGAYSGVPYDRKETSMARPKERDVAVAKCRSTDALKAPTYVKDEDSCELRRPTTSSSRPACIAAARSLSQKPKRERPSI
jgi:hypothetical protein